MKFKTKFLSVAILSSLSIPALAIDDGGARSIAARSAVAKAQTMTSGALARASADTFMAKGVNIGTNGTEHVRMERTHAGLPVLGGDIVMHIARGGKTMVSSTLPTVKRPASLTPRISKAQAIVNAGVELKSTIGLMPTAELAIYARKQFRNAPALVWQVNFRGQHSDGTEADVLYIVNAHTGKVEAEIDRIHTAFRPGPDRPCGNATAAVGIGKTVRLGNVSLDTSDCGRAYSLIDRKRGNTAINNMAQRSIGMGITFANRDNVWGDNTMRNSASIAAEAAYGAAMTWDYFLNVHGRKGIANDGRGAVSRVHFGRNWFNASWSDACFCMAFGDGNPTFSHALTVLDVAAHEMAHGVMSSTAAMEYRGESGGLNEANSDIFGAMVEFYAKNMKDKPDYLIGERIYKANDNLPVGAGQTALRFMFKPSLDGRSPDCWNEKLGTLDVHYSSGVGNHFFYLLAEGTVVPKGFGKGTKANLKPADLVCAGPSRLKGIGRGKAEKIWYAALTNYMTSDTNYKEARRATLLAATDLHGAQSAEYKAVAAAWNAVLVK